MQGRFISIKKPPIGGLAVGFGKQLIASEALSNCLSIYQKYKRNIFLLLKNSKIQSFEEIAASSIPFI